MAADLPTRRNRGGAASRAPARPSALRLWLRRRRNLLKPAGLTLLGLGALGAIGVGVIAADPAGRIAAIWDRTADLGAGAGLVVQEVILEGHHNAPLGLLREAIAVRRGDPILGFDPRAARERVEMIAWVERAHVERHLNGTIRVRLEERRPFAFWQRDGRISVIDREGQVVATENIGQFGRLPLVVGAGAERAAGRMIDLMSGQPLVMDRTHALVRISERRWNLRLRNGTDVLLPEGHEAAALARLAELQQKQALMDRPLAAIDLRLPDKLVLRLPQGQQPTPDQNAQRGRSGRG
jgi:cell division protein FtsQ